MLQRLPWFDKIDHLFRTHRIVVLLGPRQCGKTTLAKQYAKDAIFFDLENPEVLKRLENPVSTLTPLSGLIVIDEVQRQPDLFPTLRYIHDEFPDKRFLLLGSASKTLIQQSSETLAGRIAYCELSPFTLSETQNMYTLWLRGGYPHSYLAETDDDSYTWRMHYIRSYLEQDLQMLGIHVTPSVLRQFWAMLTHYHGQIFNGSEISSALSITQPTAKHYLNILAETFMIRILRPWYANTTKRQVKSPKIYWRDSGLFHYFLHCKNHAELTLHPKIGASWEGFALEEIVRYFHIDQHDCYFWAGHSFGEIDLVVQHQGKMIGFEFKLNDAPSLDRNWRKMMNEIGLNHLYIVYPGQSHYPLAEGISTIGLAKIQEINPLPSLSA